MSYYLICACAHPMISTSAVGGAQCHSCGGWKSMPLPNFKPSDTPETGPTKSPDTPQGPGPTSKEIA